MKRKLPMKFTAHYEIYGKSDFILTINSIIDYLEEKELKCYKEKCSHWDKEENECIYDCIRNYSDKFKPIENDGIKNHIVDTNKMVDDNEEMPEWKKKWDEVREYHDNINMQKENYKTWSINAEIVTDIKNKYESACQTMAEVIGEQQKEIESLKKENEELYHRWKDNIKGK